MDVASLDHTIIGQHELRNVITSALEAVDVNTNDKVTQLIFHMAQNITTKRK